MLNKAVIDLRILKENAVSVKNKLKKGVKFCAVVKADAYGHGACKIANELYSLVDCFAVATLEEALELRYAGIDKQILCLTPFFKEDLSRAVNYNLTATVTAVEQIKMLNAEGIRQGKTVSIHLKYNAGMNRQGVDLNVLKNIISLIERSERVELAGVYAHLSAPENKIALKSQVNKFLLANNFVKGYNNNAIAHISASGGFLRGIQADMVRIGILLYGYKPFKSNYISVRPVMKVYAPKIEHRDLSVGEGALYGNKIANKPVNFNLVRYGYADGLFRKEVSGIFNNRCMDLSAITEGEQTQWGYPIMEDAEVWARRYKTISYEILTKSALRAEKIYID